MKYDLIVPTNLMDFKYFTSNVQSWYKYLPIKKLYIGSNCQDKKTYQGLKDYMDTKENVEFIDQRGIQTLGMQITDLMKRTTTEWFIYCHSDVEIAKYSFLVMEAFKQEEKVGIIESERVQYTKENPKHYPDQYPHYHYIPRSFSGYQLIYKPSIQDVIEEIEDDYVFRNEDIIFQNRCVANGYRYVKALSALHVHTPTMTNLQWTPKGLFTTKEEAEKETYDMQVKGIVKYCVPDSISMEALFKALSVCHTRFGLDLFEFIKGFVSQTNPPWEEEIMKEMLQRLWK